MYSEDGVNHANSQWFLGRFRLPKARIYKTVRGKSWIFIDD